MTARMGRILRLLSVLLLPVLADGAPRYGQLLRVPFDHCRPESRPAFWRALDARPGAFTELALFSRFSNGAETLDYHRPALADVTAFVREGKARGYALGVNILPSVAFPEVFASQRVPNGRNRVFNDGVEHVGTLCMNAPETLAYVRDLCALYASTGVDFLYLDDDVDLAHCFCSACCGGFSARIGRPVADVKAFKAELDAADPARRRKARDAWIDMADEVRARLFAAAAEGAHSVSPRIELGCMTCGNAISDTAGGRWSAALAGSSGTRVRWRPGGGSWTDQSREDLLRKIDTCLLQVRGADAWIQFEEESFPYHGLRKAPGYLGFECLQYVASGADSVAFNILNASSPALEDELKPSLDRAAAIAPALRELHETFGRRASGGFSFPWGRFAVVAEQSPWSDWGQMPKEFVMARIGLPAASDPSAAQVILLNGDAAAGMDAGSLSNALSGGVMMDAAALEALWKRGFGPLAGFAPDGSVPRTSEFRDLDHPLNLPGCRVRDVLYTLTSGREKEIPVIRKSDPRAEFLSAAFANGVVRGHNAGVFENGLGGRVAVSTQLAFTECEGLPRAEHLKRLFRWLSRETLPGYVKSFHRVVLRARGDAFFAANFSSDAVRDVELALLGDGAYDVSVFVGGEKKECFRLAPAGRDGPYGIYRLPELPNLGQALLVLKEK